MKRVKTTVKPDQDGTRLDIAVSSLVPDLSRRKVRSIIDAGGVYVNRKRLRIASRSVRRGDEIEVVYDLESLHKLKRVQFDLHPSDILLEDADLFILNKPPGLPSQATKDQAVQHVVPWLQEFLKKRGDKKENLILVHRLDKETSGAIIVARSKEAATELTDLFRGRTIKKTYECIATGSPRAKSFIIDNYLSEIDKRTGNVRSVHSGGKKAITSFVVQAVREDLKLLWIECSPETGRSHQIRVHLAEYGLPIVGDKRYGNSQQKNLKNEVLELTQEHQMLHARRLRFEFRGKKYDVTAEYPEKFKKLLAYVQSASVSMQTR